MSYLTGPRIEEAIESGSIVIEPYIPEHVGPNSVDLRLGETILQYAVNNSPYHPRYGYYLDSRKEPVSVPTHREKDGSYILRPGVLYIARTLEHVETDFYMPEIDGRSSMGRLGCSIHVTAGRGDVGFKGTFTLEITVVHPLRVYPGDRICQIFFNTVEGRRRLYRGRYQGQEEPTPSRFHLEGFPPDGGDHAEGA